MSNHDRKKLNPLFKRLWFIFNISWTLIYLYWRVFYTIPFGFGSVALIAGSYLVIVEITGMFEALVHYFNMHDIHVHEVPDVPLECMPDVDVFIATYSEPTDLLFKTINGCLNMDYPDTSKVHIYLCDDGKRAEMRELAEQMGIHYLERQDHKGAKAGNLNHAMSVTNSPFIVTFDADMIPKHNFLMKTIPYFVDAEVQNEKNKDDTSYQKIKMGFVQTPQSFYNPDLFQFNLFSEGRIPNEQDYFYQDVQVSRNKSNSVIYGGSNTVLSRAALEEVGGFYTKTVTEDFATGILMQKKKYKCFATSEVLASGLSPTDLKSLIQQRNRWGRGCIATGRKMHLLFSRSLTLSQKVNYLASIWYWYAPLKRLIYIMAPILFAVFNVMVVECDLIEVLIFWLPMYISSNICLRMLSQNIRTTKWTNIYETVLFPFMLIPVIMETFGVSMKKFKVTKKSAAAEKQKPEILYAIPHLILLTLDFIGICLCVQKTFQSGQLYYMVILFWLLVNLFNLTMSVFFILGRRIYRKNERIYAHYPCQIQTQLEMLRCRTKNFSEGGVLIEMERPVYISEDEEVEIILNSERYHVVRKAQVVHVKELHKRFEYAFYYTDVEEQNADYLNLIYDRVPALPHNLDDSLSSFDDLRLNVTGRMKKGIPQNRKLPRVHMDEVYMPDEQKENYKVIDFNFEYITIQTDEKKESVTLFPDEQMALQGKLIKTLENGNKLYHIENYKEINYDAKKRQVLDKWTANGWKKADDKQQKKYVKQQAIDELSELDFL